jgi:hypothetical protein
MARVCSGWPSHECLAVALRKLDPSYARHTRDLDKARAHIAVLRDGVDEAWEVAEGQAAKVDKFRVTAMITMAAEPQASSSAGSEESAADDGLYKDDTSGNVLHDVFKLGPGAEVINMTGKAVTAQAHLTMKRTDHIRAHVLHPLPVVSAPYHHPGSNTTMC